MTKVIAEIERIDAWARSTLIARSAFEALKVQYPNVEFSQRRKSWVED